MLALALKRYLIDRIALWSTWFGGVLFWMPGQVLLTELYHYFVTLSRWDKIKILKEARRNRAVSISRLTESIDDGWRHEFRRERFLRESSSRESHMAQSCASFVYRLQPAFEKVHSACFHRQIGISTRISRTGLPIRMRVSRWNDTQRIARTQSSPLCECSTT